MSLWLDFFGAQIRYVNTPSFGRIRIAEAGRGQGETRETILFQHGMNGHLEAYAKNLIPLAEHFHVIAFDYVGHGLSDKKIDAYNPAVFAEQLRELMDVLGIPKAHLSGESLGGWVSGLFAAKYPERVGRLMLNTAAGIPVVTDKGKADMANFMALNKANVDKVPNRDSVTARMQWLLHPNNHHLLAEELIDLRLRIYLAPETRRVAPTINQIIAHHDEYLIPLDQLQCETLFLWTADNPIHDLEAARKAASQVASSQVYLMKGDSAHWPQYEAPEEFNAVATSFFATGKV
jgi:pimeloyl-ACP methyl ester carboxylesterase